MSEGGETATGAGALAALAPPAASASASALAAAVDDDRAAVAAGLMSLGSASVDRAASLSPSPSLSSSSNSATDQTPPPSVKRRRRKGKARALPTAKERQRRRKLHRKGTAGGEGEGVGAAGAAKAKENEGTEPCQEDVADESARSAGTAPAKSPAPQPHEQVEGEEANGVSAVPSSAGGDSSGGGSESLPSPPRRPPGHHHRHPQQPNHNSFKSPTAHFEHIEASASSSKSKVLSREDQRRAGFCPETGSASPPVLSAGTQLAAAAAMASAPAKAVYCDPGEGGACTVKRGAIYGNIAQAAAAATASMAKKKNNVKKVSGFGRADAIAAEEQIRTAVAAVYDVAKEEVLLGKWSSRVRNGHSRSDEGGGKGKGGSKAGKGKGGDKGKGGAGKDAPPSSAPPPTAPAGAAAASPAPAPTTLAASASESSATSAVSASAPALHTTEAYKAEAARLKRMRLASATTAAALHHTTEAGKAEAARLKRMKLNESYGRSVDPITEMRATAAAVRKVAAPTCGGAALSALSGFTPKVLTPPPPPHASQPHQASASPQPPALPPLAVPQIHPRDKKRERKDGSSSSAKDNARRVRPRLTQHDPPSAVVIRPNDILVHPPYSTSNLADKAAAKAAFHRVGNRRFRVAVEWNLGTYFNTTSDASHRDDGVRQRTVEELMKGLGSSVPPARFLRRKRRSSEPDLEDEEGEVGSYEAMSHDEVVEYVHWTFLRAGKALGFTTAAAANATGTAITPPPATTGASPDASSVRQQQQQQRAPSPASTPVTPAAGGGKKEQDDDVVVAAAALLSQQRSHLSPLPPLIAGVAGATVPAAHPSPAVDEGRRREDMVRAAAQAIGAGQHVQAQAQAQQQPSAPPPRATQQAAPQADDGARAAAAAREAESAAVMLAERRRAERYAKVRSIEMQPAALRSAAGAARRFAEEEEKKGRRHIQQLQGAASASSPPVEVAAVPSIATPASAAPPSAMSLVPGKNDVLIIQGAISPDSVGNRRLRILVECNLLSYLRAANCMGTSAPEEEDGTGNAKAAPSARKRVDKRDPKRRRLEIIDGIVRAVRCCSVGEGGGRFLQLSSSSGSSRSTTSCWAEISPADIAKAIDRTFRECAERRRDGSPGEWIRTTLRDGLAAADQEDGEKAPRADTNEDTGSLAHAPAHFTTPATAAAAAAASEDGRGELEVSVSSRKTPRSPAAAPSPAIPPHFGQLHEAGFAAANAAAKLSEEEEAHHRHPVASAAAPPAATSDREKFIDLLDCISDKERELQDALRDERIASDAVLGALNGGNGGAPRPPAIAAAVPQAPALSPSAGPSAAAAAMGAAAVPSPGQVSLEEIRARTRQLMQQMSPKEVAALMVSAHQQHYQQQESCNTAATASGVAGGVAPDLVVPGAASSASAAAASTAAVALEERITTEQLGIDELKARAKELLHQREMLRMRQMQQRHALVGEALLKARQHAQLQQQQHQAAAAAAAAQHQAEMEPRNRAASEIAAPGASAGGGAGAGAFPPSMLSLALAVQQAAALLQAEGGQQDVEQRVGASALPDETHSTQSSSARDRISASPPREAAWGQGGREGGGGGGESGRVPARRVSVQAEDESEDELSANGLAFSEEATPGRRDSGCVRTRQVNIHAQDEWKRTASSSSAPSLLLADAAAASSPPPHDGRQQPHSIVQKGGGDRRGSLTKKVDPVHVTRTGVVAGQFDDCDDEEEDIHLLKQRRQLRRAPAEPRDSTQGNDLLDVIGGMMMMKNQS